MENNKKLILDILKQVKQNKKYKTISDDIIINEILSYLKSHSKIKSEKHIVKEIRAKLHRFYSSYQTKGKRKRNIYLEKLKEVVNGKNTEHQISEITNKLLSTTLSTKERLNDYPTIYQKIFEITGNPKKIIDLGSGINPISFPYINLDNLNYYAYDIDLDDIKFINNYFDIIKSQGLNGKAEISDIRNLEKIQKLPESDIVFMFKLIDLIDEKSKRKKKISEEIITYLLKNKTNFIVASFATKSLTRKSMKLPERTGFEKMLLRNNLKFKSFSTNNEVFYVIDKTV